MLIYISTIIESSKKTLVGRMCGIGVRNWGRIWINKRNPFAGMTKEEAIEAIRKVREKLWEEKFAVRH